MVTWQIVLVADKDAVTFTPWSPTNGPVPVRASQGSLHPSSVVKRITALMEEKQSSKYSSQGT